MENVAEGLLTVNILSGGESKKSVDLMGSFHDKGVGSNSVGGGKVMPREPEGPSWQWHDNG